MAWPCMEVRLFLEKKNQTGATNVGVKVMINDTDAHHHTLRSLSGLFVHFYYTIAQKRTNRNMCTINQIL